MKKNLLLKVFSAVLLTLVLAIFLNGCVIYVGNPIVEINITNDNWKYDIYVDGSFQGTTDNTGKLILHNVSAGYHHFEAQDTSFLNRYGDKWQTITSGYNRVNISTY